MVELCTQNDVIFRPHFKTHQSAEIADWFAKAGVNRCAVSSLSMGEYFFEHGWIDICVAIPVNLNELETANRLAEKARLSLTVDHPLSLLAIKQQVNNPLTIFIEIDTGYGRSGVFYKNTQQIDALLSILTEARHLRFGGFLSHTGNNYGAANRAMGQDQFEKAREIMVWLKETYAEQYPNLLISMGDTPSSAFASHFQGIDEWRPGNFVFNDLMQLELKSCEETDLAFRVRCPVIGVYPHRNEIVIYGGAVHLSKDSMVFADRKVFGWAVMPGGKIADGFPVISLSQEHGIILANESFVRQIQPGDWLEILPVHSCLSADLCGYFHTTDGEKISKFRTYPNL